MLLRDVAPDLLSAAFDLVFRQGRSPPSCPAPDDSDLCRRIMALVPAASLEDCRDALQKVRELSRQAYRVCDAYRDGVYGKGRAAETKAVRELAAGCPGFSEDQYRTAFSVGMLWTAF